MKAQIKLNGIVQGIFQTPTILQKISCGEANTVQLHISLKDALSNLGALEQTIFLADLLKIHSVYITDEIESALPASIRKIYVKSRFSNQKETIIHPASRTNIEYSDGYHFSLDKQHLIEGKLRSIIFWEGECDLLPQKSIDLILQNNRYKAIIVQVQKVILTDYSGSQFGIPRLKNGQFGTVVLDLGQNFSYFPYIEKPSSGFFIIREGEKIVGCGICIK